MILVDSSIWIGYFSKGLHRELDRLLIHKLIVINDIIRAELLPYMFHAEAYEAIRSLQKLKCLELNIHWPSIIKLQRTNLQNGVNKVQVTDLIIAHNALEHNAIIWTNDKHFSLMAPHSELKLFKP